eukprot:337461_1
MYLYLKLGDILQCQEGFEAMMRFLVGEFSCENLLCYVELSQYICTWGQQTIHNSINNNINNDIEEDCTLVNQMNIQLGSSSHQSSHQSSNGINSNIINGNGTHDRNGTIHDITANDNNHRSAQIKVEQFPYFENPEFEDELAHYEYIMQKYIYDSACLQINISGALRLEAQTVSPGMDNERIIKMINAIRSELWSLMRDSFTRFRSTTEYSKLADKLQHKSEFKWLFKNLHRRVDSPRNNKTDIIHMNLNRNKEDLQLDEKEEEQQLDTEYKTMNEDSCFVKECKTTRRILNALKYYSSIKDANQENSNVQLVEYCMEYKTILDDHIHIVTKHNNTNDLDEIYNILNVEYEFAECDINSCGFSLRHYRNRNTDQQVKKESDEDNNYMFYR